MPEVHADDPAQATPGTTHDDAQKGAQESSEGKGKYRERLAAAEAERDRLAGVVAAMQQAEVDRIVEGEGLRPAVIKAAGVDLADLLTEDGTVNVEAVQQAAGVARDELGLGPRSPMPDPNQGQMGGSEAGAGDTWTAAFGTPGG